MDLCLRLLLSCLPFLNNTNDHASVIRHAPVPREKLPSLLVHIDTRDGETMARLQKEAQKATIRRKRREARERRKCWRRKVEEWKVERRVLEELGLLEEGS